LLSKTSILVKSKENINVLK